MQNFVEVTVPQDLLPQVVGELLSFTTDPNRVEVVHGPQGQVIHVDPLVAEAWLDFRRTKEAADKAELLPEPVAEAAPAPAPEPAPEPEPEPAPVAAPAPAVTPEPGPTTLAAPQPTPAPPVAPTPAPRTKK